MGTDPLESTFKTDKHEIGGGPGTVRGILWVYPGDHFSTFLAGTVRLGRGEDCAMRLPGAEVSRHHAELRRLGPISTLSDLGSTNGTFVNGERLEVTEVALADQDVVRLGEWIGIVCTAPDQPKVGLTEVEGLVCGLRMQALLAAAAQVAKSRLPVILLGESGTGKELLSRFIHDKSGRSGRLLAVNCAALPENLAESELFGHKKGAFTGAERASDGHIRAADRGTLFLDEIGDLPLSIQAKLLRVVEQAQVVPLGSSMSIDVDVRLIAAGQYSLAAAVRSERFRGDLYARLNGIEFRLPPLRERREEIPAIFRRVVESELRGHPVPAFSPRLLERLCLYHWPFNVRELVQVARQLAVLYRERPVWTEDFLPSSVTDSTGSEAPSGHSERQGSNAVASAWTSEGRSLVVADPDAALSLRERRERARGNDLLKLQSALDTSGGNVSEAAKSLGISRRKAYRLLKGVDAEELDG